jgi:DNA-binding beta-propeller fold protein YncE
MFVDPSMVALSGADAAFVSDTTAFGHGGLIAVDLSSGQQRKVASSTQFHRPFGLACQADGQLVVAYMEGEHAPGTVMRVNPANGDHHAVAPGVQFFMPVGVALDAADNVIFIELDVSGENSVLHRVDHGVGHSILASGSPRGAMYSGVAIEPGGGILVTDGQGHPAPRLLRFDPVTGAVATVSQGQKLGNPLGVAVEATGAILVADPHGGIIRIDPGTGAQTIVAEPGSLSFPSGVAVVR